MAREEKRIELREVDDEVEILPPAVIRLESEETLQKAKPARLGTPDLENMVSQRLDLPSRDEVESRTHQPGIEALIEGETASPDVLESNWGEQSARYRSIPWGWFALIGLLLAGGVIWSLTRVAESDDKAHEVRVATENMLIDDKKEEREAAKLIDTIHDTTRRFFEATTIDGLLKYARQPDHVRPLMEKYYASRPVSTQRLGAFRILQPITLDHHGNFWMASVNLANGETRNILLEILPSGEARVDWETLVCYQPMPWDEFATRMPRGTSLDFRVYVEPDNLYSHEFADSTRWTCFRLNTLNSDETLFGYAHADSALSQEIIGQLQRNGGHRASMILRLSIPEGTQSHRGVVIEKLMSPRWLYMNPPES